VDEQTHEALLNVGSASVSPIELKVIPASLAFEWRRQNNDLVVISKESSKQWLHHV